MHPRLAALIAFCDGEAGAKRSHRIAGHLAKCQKCSDRLRSIRAEKATLSTGAPMPVMDSGKGLAGVLSAIATWRTDPAPASELRRRLREQIETYFGSRALTIVDGPGMPAEDLLGRTSELLDVFLGPAAAELVKDDVLSGLDYGRPEAR